MSRIHNFSAGPAVLPLAVLEQAKEALVDFNGSGMGIMEISHRGSLFQKQEPELFQSIRCRVGASRLARSHRPHRHPASRSPISTPSARPT